MKRKGRIAWLLTAAMLAALCAGCGAKGMDAPTGPAVPDTPPAAQEQTTEPAPPEIDYDAVYTPVLDETCEVLYNGYDDERGYRYVPAGLYELAMWLDRDELLGSVGYVIADLSGDGVPELLIGMLPDETAEVETKCVVFGGYTCSGGEPAAFLEGWARNSYQWLGGGRFYNFGSAGAVYSAFGAFRLSEDATELICEDFYFTHEKDESFQEIGLYHNTTGAWDREASEELDMTDEAFWQIMDAYESECLPLELTPFSDYAYTGAIDAPRGSGSEVRADYLEDVAAELTYYEDAALYDGSLGGGDYETTVVFRSDAGVRTFRVLALALRDVDAAGRAVFDVSTVLELPALRAGIPLAVPMSFPGDIPNNGFSYVDEQGITRQFTLSMSGRDGSLVIAPLE